MSTTWRFPYQLKRGLPARLASVGLMPGELALDWTDPANPRLMAGNRSGAACYVLPAAHTHSEADLTAVAWASITGRPSTFTPEAHAHTIANVTGLQATLDSKSATTHTHDFSASYAPLTHRHAWSQLDNVPATFAPPVASASTLGGVKAGNGVTIGTDGTLSVAAYSLPVATSSALGGVKAGSNVTIAADGTLSVAAPYTHPATHPWSMLTGVPSSFTPAAHSHAIADLPAYPTLSSLGAAAASHTHDFSATYAAKAHSHVIGDLPAYPTLASLGAAAASHTHAYVPTTGTASMVGGLASFVARGSGADLRLKDISNGLTYAIYAEAGVLKMIQV